MKIPRTLSNTHYNRIRSYPALRQRLIDNVIAGLKELFGSMPEGSYRVEVIPREPDTITIVLPTPADGEVSDAASMPTRAMTQRPRPDLC